MSSALLQVPDHTLSMSLTPKLRYSRACCLEPDGSPGPWTHVGDITFSPRGTRLKVVAPGAVDSYKLRAPAIKRDLFRIL